MTLLAVNHHYVAEEGPAAPRAIFPTTVAQLERELDLLARAFEFVSRDDLVGAVESRRSLPERACLITFDDGLRSQVELALPVLERRRIPALFLVTGLPLAERRALQVHKIHHLRERLADAELLELLDARLPGIEATATAEAAEAMYGYDEPEAARVKYLLNIALPFAERDAWVDSVFAEVLGEEASFAAALYASAEQVAELERRHAAVGAHSYAHRPLSRLTPAELRDDLARNVEMLSEVTGAHPRVISYPYGSPDAVDASVAQAAARAGFAAGFTMERAFNGTLEEPLLLARIDVNDAPGGAAPLFELDGDGPRVLAGMSRARTRYVDEGALR